MQQLNNDGERLGLQEKEQMNFHLSEIIHPYRPKILQPPLKMMQIQTLIQTPE